MVWSKHGEDDDHDIVHVIEGLQKLEKVKRDLKKEEKVAIAKVVEIYEAEKLAEEQVKIVRKIQQERKEEECDAAVEKKLKDLEKAAVEKLFMHLKFLESKDVKGMVRQLLVTEGPMMQSQFLPKWRKMFPDNQFDLVTWGFERLTAALEALPDLVVITKDGPKKSFLSLKGGPPPPIGGAAADVAAPKGAGMSREVMTGVVAGVIASKGSVDPATVQAFMKQPKLQFTIDCLVEEFAKFSAAGGATAAAKPKRPKRPRRKPDANGAPAGQAAADGE